MELSQATSSDIDQITKLFRQNLQNVNSKDYNNEQIQIWSSVADRKIEWLKIINEQNVIVTTKKNQITGFATITNLGFLNFLYVNYLFQKQGISDKLLKELENISRENKNEVIYCNASNTAKGFFLKNEFKAIKAANQEAEGLVFEMTRMEKQHTTPM